MIPPNYNYESTVNQLGDVALLKLQVLETNSGSAVTLKVDWVLFIFTHY